MCAVCSTPLALLSFFYSGGTVRPKVDLSRYVKWPKYVRIQRQRSILKARLKVPPSLNQFSKTLDKPTAVQLFKLLNKYRPETHVEKKARLLALAQAKADKKTEGIVFFLSTLARLITFFYFLFLRRALQEAHRCQVWHQPHHCPH